MKYLSVCSGIEAATVAWHPLGWQPVAFGEIEKFPCQVLEHHYPNTPNWGDMTKFKEWQDADVNVFVGGTPCQSFSVAGLRKGLDDPRGNLMLTYLAIAARYRPQWLVWENVPGVLSSNAGLDFASLLRGMGECGYGFAYRILDAQYFGVAQRRRRVFVVGYLGNWRPAAAVLFERHSLQGHPAPSREKGQGITPTIKASVGTGDVDVEHPMVATVRMVAFGEYSDDCSASAMKACDYKDATDLVIQPIAFDAYNQTTSETVTALRCAAGGVFDNTVAQPVYELHSQDSRVKELGDVCTTVSATYGAGGGNVPITLMPAMAVAVGTDCYNGTITGDITMTLKRGDGNPAINQPTVLQAMAVRRLTPVECERLQGFPDRYTDIQPKGKATPDGPRYKALGNSMAVPVMAWIGKRIQEVDAICKTQQNK